MSTSGAVTVFPAPASIPSTATVGDLLRSRSFGAAWTLTNGSATFSDNATGAVYQFAITNPAGASPTFDVIANYQGPGGVLSNDGATCLGEPTTLTITKAGPPVVAPGGTITWTVVVTNSGTTTSSGFAFSDTVPAAITNVASPTPGCSVAGNTVSCAGGQLAAGDSVPITITGTAPASGCVTNTATVLGNESPGSVTSNPVQTCVVAMLLVKFADRTFVTAVGQPIVYTFTVQNISAVAISAITITDTPAGHGSQLGTITCTPGLLPAGQTANCTAQRPYLATTGDVAAGEILNTATAAGIASGSPVQSNPYSVSVDVRLPLPPGTAVLVNTGNTIGVTP